MSTADLIQLLREFGFPSAVALLVLLRLDRSILRVRDAVDNLRTDVARLNGRRP